MIGKSDWPIILFTMVLWCLLCWGLCEEAFGADDTHMVTVVGTMTEEQAMRNGLERGCEGDIATSIRWLDNGGCIETTHVDYYDERLHEVIE